ncbi:glycosyltransferase family 4 protein [Mucilaginibacter litoreus]|uniref:Glycosyltransferase family 4 protein n=1 Tax=Mucilaginibacter litoreus TaxID=1048221 RepID=A0ABW3AVG6_9SPHI
MTRTLAHSLSTICAANNWDFKLSSLYDNSSHLMPQYVRAQNFEGYNKHKVRFLLKNIFAASHPNVVILTHINLAIIGLCIKLLKPKTQVWLIAHGIEVWRPLRFHKRKLLHMSTRIICVSDHTKRMMHQWHHANPAKCVTLNNALDPFMKLPVSFNKTDRLMKKYDLTASNKVLFSLTRLASTEVYKGHDKVIKAVGRLKFKFPDIRYILAGQYDDVEYKRVLKLINDAGVKDHVILTGFIAEDELPDYFSTADLFILPSKKEGFGIVFIEALSCGLPVICGNADGSVDAIRHGELGTAIDPEDDIAIEKAIEQQLLNNTTPQYRKRIQQKCLEYFGEQTYISKLQKMLLNEPA